MLRVALLRYFVAQLAHPADHHPEHIRVVFVLVVLAELDQLQQEEEGD